MKWQKHNQYFPVDFCAKKSAWCGKNSAHCTFYGKRWVLFIMYYYLLFIILFPLFFCIFYFILLFFLNFLSLSFVLCWCKCKRVVTVGDRGSSAVSDAAEPFIRYALERPADVTVTLTTVALHHGGSTVDRNVDLGTGDDRQIRTTTPDHYPQNDLRELSRGSTKICNNILITTTKATTTTTTTTTT